MAQPAPRPEDDPNFDPYAEREIDSPTSDIAAVLNILKGVVGIGFLALPRAFSKAGTLVGSIGLVLLSYLGAYCMCMLMRTQYILCKRKKVGYLEYQDSMKAAIDEGPPCLRPLGTVTKGIVNVFYIANQFGICIGYLMFVAKNIQALVNEYHPEMKWVIQIYISFVAIVFLAITFVPNLKFLAPLSGLATLISLVACGIIYYYVSLDFPNPLERPLVKDPGGWLLFVGTTLFAVISVGLCTSSERTMKNPGHFGGICGVCSISTTLTLFITGSVAFTGYVKYGDEARDSVTLNLPPEEPLAQSDQILFATSVLMSMGLQLYPAIEIIWYCYILPRCKEKPRKTQWFYQYILRTLSALFIYAMTCGFGEDLEVVLSLGGVICVATVGIAFPAMMEMCVLWPDRLGRGRWVMWKDIAIIFIGTVALVVGTYVAIDDFVRKRLEEN